MHQAQARAELAELTGADAPKQSVSRPRRKTHSQRENRRSTPNVRVTAVVILLPLRAGTDSEVVCEPMCRRSFTLGSKPLALRMDTALETQAVSGRSISTTIRFHIGGIERLRNLLGAILRLRSDHPRHQMPNQVKPQNQWVLQL